jgi:hypothetical protein
MECEMEGKGKKYVVGMKNPTKVRSTIAKWAVAAILMLAFLPSCTYDKLQPDVCFESEVLPVFVTYCSTSGCHNGSDLTAGYDLTNYNGIMQGIRPKSVAGSELLSAMTGGGEESMPPRSYPQPSSDQIATIKAWVKSGAANTTNCNAATCDTSGVATYAAVVEPILQTYCVGCHSGGSPSGNVDLANFATLQQYALAGTIMGTITNASGYRPMPPNGSLLPACDIAKIKQWVNAGALQN